MSPSRTSPAVAILLPCLALLLSPPSTSAQVTYNGVFQGMHSIQTNFLGNGCPIERRPRTGTSQEADETFSIQNIPSDFSCPIFRIDNATASVTAPTADLLAEIPDPAANFTTASLLGSVQSSVNISGNARFIEGGDRHSIRVGTGIGISNPTQPIERRRVRGGSGCSAQDDFTSSQPGSQAVSAAATCDIDVLNVVPNSIVRDADGSAMQFEAQIVSDIFIVMDHGSAATGRTLGRGGRYAITTSSTFVFQAIDMPEPPPIPDGDPILSTNRQGFVFHRQSGVPQQMPLEIVNTGGQELSWTAQANTRSGGGWLFVLPTNGMTTAARESSFVNVAVDPSGLTPGDYYGSVTVSGDPNNPPQTLTVATRIVPPGDIVPLETDVDGLVFIHTPPIGARPRTVMLTNPGSRPIEFDIEPSFGDGPAWFSVTPPGDSIVDPGATVPFQIQVDSDFTPGVSRGEIVITNGPVGGPVMMRRLAARLIVPPTAGTAPLAGLARQQGVCAPTQLVAIFARPSLDFAAVAGWPSSIEAIVVDDCGVPMTAGLVTVSFSNGDPLLVLEHLRDGRWVGTWAPISQAEAVTLTLSVSNLQQPSLETTLEITGGVPETAAVPILGAPPLSAISFARDLPISLGGFTALFGLQLAGGLTAAEALPLPDVLDETSVFFGGIPMPLLFSSGGQINGIIPFGLATGVRHSLLVQRGATISSPLRVLVAEAQPALFSKDSTGSGQGLIERVSPDGTRSLAEPGTPARPGDVLVIYASGLGLVNAELNAADASPTSPLAETVEPVTILIGGASANVVFAGLTPGFAGLFQVNVPVSAEVATGDAVEVTAGVGDATSPPVTIAIAP